MVLMDAIHRTVFVWNKVLIGDAIAKQVLNAYLVARILLLTLVQLSLHRRQRLLRQLLALGQLLGGVSNLEVPFEMTWTVTEMASQMYSALTAGQQINICT